MLGIGLVGVAVGAGAVLVGQFMSGRTTERVAHRARRHVVLDDVSVKLASVREQALAFQFLWPDADEQTRDSLNEALTRLRKGDSKLRVLDKT